MCTTTTTTIRNSCPGNIRKKMENREKSSGYTLIEMSIVMIVVGVILAASAVAYDLFLRNKKEVQTEISMSQITVSIGNFRAQYGRYPCPASLTAARGSADYGREKSDCTDLTVAIGTCSAAEGYCVEQSEAGRTIDHDNDGATPTPTPEIRPRVRRGALPFKSMNVPEEYAYDGYGNRIVYVVTERLAVANTFNLAHGGISIVDDQTPTPESLLEAPGVGHFLIISPGRNNAGGYNNNGLLVQACPAATTPEGKNCDVTGIAEYVQTGINTTQTNTHFDDRLSFFSSVEMSLWQRTAANRNNIEQRPGGFVGFNDSAPGDVAAVAGKMKTDGKLHTQEVCDESGTPGVMGNCFGSGLIGGSGMNCDNGKYMVGIKDGDVDCVPNVAVGCPPNQLLEEVRPDGSLRCSLRGCSARVFNFCAGVSVSVPAGADNTSYLDPVTGISFLCSNRSWTASSGQVSAACCKPGLRHRDQPCPPGETGGPVKVTITKTCNPPKKKVKRDDSLCIAGPCTPGSKTTFESCPPGYTGGPVKVKTKRTCNPMKTKVKKDKSLCVSDSDDDDSDDRPPPVCSWQPVNQTGVVNTNSLPRPAVGNVCACGSSNRSCFAVGVPGVIYKKFNCRCSEN